MYLNSWPFLLQGHTGPLGKFQVFSHGVRERLAVELSLKLSGCGHCGRLAGLCWTLNLTSESLQPCPERWSFRAASRVPWLRGKCFQPCKPLMLDWYGGRVGR